MIFNRHSNLAGRHAFLTPSSPHWLGYSDEKLDSAFIKSMSAAEGTRRHEFAATAIRLGIRLDENVGNKTVARYVNDAIGLRMEPEQTLYYSDNCFGTTDAISFHNNLLRIHDLKNGHTRTSMVQLKSYCALFFLEYGYDPLTTDMEMRIYQNNGIKLEAGDPDEILHIMDRIKRFDARINAIRLEALA